MSGTVALNAGDTVQVTAVSNSTGVTIGVGQGVTYLDVQYVGTG